MRTKKGDMVRLCFRCNVRPKGAWLSVEQYQVIKTHHPHTITVRSRNGVRHTVKSWVRCADMKEKTL
jgi:hypothetical protein